jgi:hypothetical protein
VNETQHGHLLLADISGYTSYVASTELSHLQEILTELLECMIERFEPLLTISKIEGDAIFAYAPETKLPRGEAILELIDTTYIAGRGRREAAHRRTQVLKLWKLESINEFIKNASASSMPI